MANVPRTFRRMVDKLIDMLGMYRERNIRYANFLMQFTGSGGVVLEFTWEKIRE